MSIFELLAAQSEIVNILTSFNAAKLMLILPLAYLTLDIFTCTPELTRRNYVPNYDGND